MRIFGEIKGYPEGTIFESRIEIRERITSLIRVLLKKSEKEVKAESTSNVKVDIPASNAS